MHTKEQFDIFMSQLLETNATLGFYCDFNKIKKNVSDIEISLNMLNYLLGQQDLNSAVKSLWERDKKVFEVASGIPTDLKTSVLKIKGLTVVKPEIVGGNAGLGYTYKVDSFDSTKLGVVDISDVHSDSDEIRTGLSDITITVEDLLRNKIADGEKIFKFFEKR